MLQTTIRLPKVDTGPFAFGATQQVLPAPKHWRQWLPKLFPKDFTAGFAPHHADFWEWVWTLRKGTRPRPHVAIWPRGGGKSASTEAACVAVGAHGWRDYVLYISETQDQADDHVGNIESLLSRSIVEKHYPTLAQRKVGKYGDSKGWRRQRLWTDSGFVVDAIGFDSAKRGAKLEEMRPDLIILDDIDNETDSKETVKKKVRILTKKFLPAGATDAAVLAVQNIVHEHSVFARLAGMTDEPADFLTTRIVNGPVPAIEGFTYEQRYDEELERQRFFITAGTPTWEGQDLEKCQEQIDDWGLTSFKQEAQHDVDAPPGGMFDHLDYVHCDWDEVPDLERIVVWVDPAVTSTDQSDSMGIQADGIARGKVYRLYSWEQVTSPEDALRRALRKAVELKAEKVGVETDQGGDTWNSVYKRAWESLVEDDEVPEITERTQQPKFDSEKAGAGHGPKVHRAQQMLAAYERGTIIHVRGTHKTLEKALNRFPKTKPLDLVDAAYWGWHDLAGEQRTLKIAYA